MLYMHHSQLRGSRDRILSKQPYPPFPSKVNPCNQAQILHRSHHSCTVVILLVPLCSHIIGNRTEVRLSYSSILVGGMQRKAHCLAFLCALVRALPLLAGSSGKLASARRIDPVPARPSIQARSSLLPPSALNFLIASSTSPASYRGKQSNGLLLFFAIRLSTSASSLLTARTTLLPPVMVAHCTRPARSLSSKAEQTTEGSLLYSFGEFSRSRTPEANTCR